MPSNGIDQSPTQPTKADPSSFFFFRVCHRSQHIIHMVKIDDGHTELTQLTHTKHTSCCRVGLGLLCQCLLACFFGCVVWVAWSCLVKCRGCFCCLLKLSHVQSVPRSLLLFGLPKVSKTLFATRIGACCALCFSFQFLFFLVCCCCSGVVVCLVVCLFVLPSCKEHFPPTLPTWWCLLAAVGFFFSFRSFFSFSCGVLFCPLLLPAFTIHSFSRFLSLFCFFPCLLVALFCSSSHFPAQSKTSQSSNSPKPSPKLTYTNPRTERKITSFATPFIHPFILPTRSSTFTNYKPGSASNPKPPPPKLLHTQQSGCCLLLAACCW